MRGVTPPRVSQWIRDGKLHGAALVGTGVRARINVEAAMIQLGITLDQVQVAAQQTATVPKPDAPALNEDQKRITTAKAAQAEIALRAAQRAEAESAGQLCRTGDVRQAWARELTELVNGIDAWLPDLAMALARDLGVDRKRATAVLRSEYRAFRQRRSDLATSAAAALPELVDEDAG